MGANPVNRGPCDQCGCDIWSKSQSQRHNVCPECGTTCQGRWQRQRYAETRTPRILFPVEPTTIPSDKIRAAVESATAAPRYSEADVRRLIDEALLARLGPTPEFDQSKFADGATVFISDVHIPLHHRKAVGAVVQFCEVNRASGWLQRLVLGGDIFDGLGNSRHKQMSRGEGHGGDLGDEIETGRGIVNALVECFPEATFMEGNHEARLWRVLAEQRGIPQAPLVFEALFQFYDYHHNLKVFNNRSLYIGRGDGEIEFIHGEKYNQHTAATLLNDNMNRNSAQGHSHRPQSFWRRGRFAVVNGHLHDADKQQYMKNPEWTMGFTIFDHWDNGRKVNPYFVRITEDGSFSFGGKVYRG